MADEQKFDTEKARLRRNDILDPMQRMVEDLDLNVVKFYWEKVPQNKDEDYRMRKYMKDRLEASSRTINNLLGKLSDVY